MCAERHFTCNRSFKPRAAENNFSARTEDTSHNKYQPDIAAHGQPYELGPLPIGWRARSCPKCDSIELVGALISDSADSFDPDILCMICGYYV